jgi:hypothetical protein
MDLNPKQQERLEQWREKGKKTRKHPKAFTPPAFVSRKRDYGDDIREYDKKDKEIR